MKFTKIDATPKGVHYSFDEVKTGDYWVDGKPIYRKCIKFDALSETNAVPNSALPNLDTIQKIECVIKSSSSGNFLPIGHMSGSSHYSVLYYTSRSQFEIRSTSDLDKVSGVIIVEYTKTTDTPT